MISFGSWLMPHKKTQESQVETLKSRVTAQWLSTCFPSRRSQMGSPIQSSAGAGGPVGLSCVPLNMEGLRNLPPWICTCSTEVNTIYQSCYIPGADQRQPYHQKSIRPSQPVLPLRACRLSSSSARLPKALKLIS